MSDNGEREVSTSQYSVEQKAQALARIRLGEPAKKVALELGYPPRTVQGWAAEMRQSALEENDRIIVDQDYHLVIRTGELLEEAIEDLADSKEPMYKYLVPLNIVRGTPEDKILKRQELEVKRGQTQAGYALADAIERLAGLTVPERDAIIEGEYVVSTDDDPDDAET